MNTAGSTSGFSFGQPTTTTVVTNNSSFSFGHSTGSSQLGAGFSFGSSSQPGATATVNPLTSSSGFPLGSSNSATASQLSTSGGFSFGQTNPATSSGGVCIGQANPTTTSGGFSFGPTNSTTTSGGFNFGQTNQATSSGGFCIGQANPATSSGGFSFGQANPTTSSSGLNLGLNTSSSGLFGQTTSSGFNFGQTTSSPAGNLSTSLFSQTQTTNPAPAVGTGPFGQTQITNPAPAVGTGPFGQTQITNPAPAVGTGPFGQTQITNPAPAVGTGPFGQTQTTNPAASSTGPFGQTQTINPAASSTALFGQSTPGSTPGLFSQSSGLFGQTSTQPIQSSAGLNFGLSTNPTSAGGLFSQTPSTSTSTGLNFGVSAPPSTGFSFTPSSASSSVPSSSIFTSITTSAAPNLGLGGSLPTSSTLSTAGGLGGFQTTSIDSGVGNTIAKGDGKSAKEAPLPQDIFSTITVFEAYKDTEKRCSEDNIRQTATPFHKLVEDTKKLRQHIVQLSNQHSQLHSSARKLKSAVIQEAENVEMARRTQDTPMNLQGDNKAPEQFFLRLVRSFEERMTFCRNRIEEVEKCARSNGTVNEITSEDMKEVLKKEHEMVKMLAAKIYTLHNQLINYTNQSSNPEMQPEALFKPITAEEQPLGISNRNFSILRPALGEGGSGLLNFQNGQQRAKALSLGAAPPTLPLTQTSLPNLLGSCNQNNPFSGSSFLNFNSSSNNNTTGFGFGNISTFGSNPTNTASLFGNQPTNPIQSSGLFCSGNNASLFGGAKTFKKSHENEESHRKRRM